MGERDTDDFIPEPHETDNNREADRERGTRKDGEAQPPDALDPAPDGKDGAIPPLPEPDVEGVGEEGGPSSQDERSTGLG